MQTKEWSIAVFSARESSSVLSQTIRALITACRPHSVVIDVLINGNAGLAKKLAGAVDNFDADSSIGIRVWYLPIPDKAATWNSYLHDIWIESESTFFVDGYVAVEPNALSRLAEELANRPNANCATGVPSDGWTARSLRKEMLLHHGIHGNLYALPFRVMQKLRQMSFRLPSGIYRNDGLLAAVLAFSMDPAKHAWSPEKLMVVPDVTWHLPPNRWWSLQNIKTRWRRRISQARGDFENRAIQQHLAIEQRSPAEIPPTARELVSEWIEANPAKAARMTRFSWRHRIAFNRLVAKDDQPSAEQTWTLLNRINLQ